MAAWLMAARRTGLVGAAAVLLAACGGGGSGSNTAVVPPVQAPAIAMVASDIFFTDDVTTDFDKIWVTVSRVTVLSPAGEVTIATYAPPRLINLPRLKLAGELMSTAAIPTNATAIRVYADPNVQLQNIDGTLRTVQLALTGGFIEFSLGSWDKAPGTLALDFDLPRFTLVNGVLTPATRLASSADVSNWTERYTKAEGTVTAISATSITIRTSHIGDKTFVIDTHTVLKSLTANLTPTVGARVEVKAVIVTTNGASQLLARSINDDGLSVKNDLTGFAEIKGRVKTVTGSTITLDALESEHNAALGTITVDLATAQFRRGTLAQVQVGQILELHAQRQTNGNWTAGIVEVEGAHRPELAGPGSGNSNSSGSVAQLKGAITAKTGNSVTLNLFSVRNFAGAQQGGTITLDLAAAAFERGNLACLAVGNALEVKGVVSATAQFQPIKAEVEGLCGATAASAGAVAPGAAEVKGTITTVTATGFTMSVFSFESASGARPATITVAYDTTTVFERVTAAGLRTGLFVEVKGIIANGVLTARKVELDD